MTDDSDFQYDDSDILTEKECPKCGDDLVWRQCWNCDEGLSDHECGEDCCCCIDPAPNVVCDICHGEGGYYVCPNGKNHKPEEKR